MCCFQSSCPFQNKTDPLTLYPPHIGCHLYPLHKIFNNILETDIISCIVKKVHKLSKVQGLAETTDIFMSSSIQQSEEWRGEWSHRYIEDAWDFHFECTCDSVVPARWCHITYCMNEYGEVAWNVSALSNLTVLKFKLVTKFFWFFSPWLFFVGLSEESCIWDAAHQFGWTWEAIHDMLQYVMDEFTKHLQGWGRRRHLLHSVLKKWTVYVSNLISKISVTC
jgi:hypothetical protein